MSWIYNVSPSHQFHSTEGKHKA